MSIEKVNIRQKLDGITDLWNPRIAGELNGQYVKLVKFKGPFIWHKHDHEDEMFLVVKGSFTMEMRGQNIEIKEGEFIIIPKGVEHKPVAKEEVEVILFEPVSTLNTGDKRTAITKDTLERI